MHGNSEKKKYMINGRSYFVEKDNLDDMHFYNFYDGMNKLVESKQRAGDDSESEDDEIMRCLEEIEEGRLEFIKAMGEMHHYKHVYLRYATGKVVTDVVVAAFVLTSEYESRSEFHEPAFLAKDIVRLAPLTKAIYDADIDCWRTPTDKSDPFYEKMHQAGHGFLLTTDQGRRIKVYNIGSPFINWRLSDKPMRSKTAYFGRHYNVFSDMDEGPHDAFLKKAQV